MPSRKKWIVSFNAYKARFRIQFDELPSYLESTFIEEGESRKEFKKQRLVGTTHQDLYEAVRGLMICYAENNLSSEHIVRVLHDLNLEKVATEFNNYVDSIWSMGNYNDGFSSEGRSLIDAFGENKPAPSTAEIARWAAARPEAESLAKDLRALAVASKRPAQRPAPLRLGSTELEPFARRIAAALKPEGRLALKLTAVTYGLQAIMEPLTLSAEIALQFGAGRKDSFSQHNLTWPARWTFEPAAKKSLAQQAAATVCALIR